MSHTPREEHWMRLALREAEAALAQGEEPVGAVIVDAASGRLLARAHHQSCSLSDPTAKAAMLALTQLASLADTGSDESDAERGTGEIGESPLILVTSQEPCLMCAGAMLLHTRVRGLIYAAPNRELGACGSLLDILGSGPLAGRIQVLGRVLEDESQALLDRYGRARNAGRN